MKLYFAILIVFLTSCAHAETCEELPTLLEVQKCSSSLLESLETSIALKIQDYSTFLPNPEELEQAQSAWKKYVGLHCGNASRIYDGGTQFDYSVIQCKVQQSTLRLQSLENDYAEAVSIIKSGAP